VCRDAPDSCVGSMTCTALGGMADFESFACQITMSELAELTLIMLGTRE